MTEARIEEAAETIKRLSSIGIIRGVLRTIVAEGRNEGIEEADARIKKLVGLLQEWRVTSFFDLVAEQEEWGEGFCRRVDQILNAERLKEQGK